MLNNQCKNDDNQQHSRKKIEVFLIKYLMTDFVFILTTCSN